MTGTPTGNRARGELLARQSALAERDVQPGSAWKPRSRHDRAVGPGRQASMRAAAFKSLVSTGRTSLRCRAWTMRTGGTSRSSCARWANQTDGLPGSTLRRPSAASAREPAARRRRPRAPVRAQPCHLAFAEPCGGPPQLSACPAAGRAGSPHVCALLAGPVGAGERLRGRVDAPAARQCGPPGPPAPIRGNRHPQRRAGQATDGSARAAF